MRVFTRRTAATLATAGAALAWATVASARIYYEPNSTAIRDLTPWQRVWVAVAALVLTGLFIAGLVKLINRFFAKK